MKKRSSALLQRTERYQRSKGGNLLGAVSAVAFAMLPLGVMLWVVPVTGIGIA